MRKLETIKISSFFKLKCFSFFSIKCLVESWTTLYKIIDLSKRSWVQRIFLFWLNFLYRNSLHTSFITFVLQSRTTVKPVLSEHRIKRTPSTERTEADVPKFISLIYFNETSIKRTPLLRTRTPKKYLKWSFLLFPTCIKRTLVIKFHHPTCHTPQMRQTANPQICIFYLKKTRLKEQLISLVS